LARHNCDRLQKPSGKGVNKLQINVKDFCKPIIKTGNLNQYKKDKLPVGLQEKANDLLANIQDEQSLITGYRKNFFIYKKLMHDDLNIELSSITCGIFVNNDIVTLENIIPTFNLNALHQQLCNDELNPHILEIKTTAWMYYSHNNIKPICQLFLVSVQNPDEHICLNINYDDVNHNIWVKKRQHIFIKKELLKQKKDKGRQSIGNDLGFPFSRPREGQIDLMNTVGDIVDNNKQGILQAPTGLGKTAGVLIPALKNALLNWKQVMYLTPKNSQQLLVLQTIEKLRQIGSPITGLIITAKERICLKEEVICNPKYCEYAQKYYDKLRKDKVIEKVITEGLLTQEIFTKYGKKYQVCPFELSLDATAHCDVIICDYNYAISPKTALKRYFDEDGKANKLNLVIDEAHNLHNRAMNHYSPELDEEILKQFLNSINTINKPFSLQGSQIIKQTIQFILDKRPDETINSPIYNRNTDDHYGHSMLIKFDYEQLYEIEQNLNKLLNRYSESQEYLSPNNPLVQLCAYIGDFCAVSRMRGDYFYHTYNVNPNGYKLVITCADPSKFLCEIWEMCASTIVFSATIKPFKFYTNILGLEPSSTQSAEFLSPFPQKNRKLLIIPQVSTLYNERVHYYDKITDAIERILPRKLGNYFLFFSSFIFLDEIYQRLKLPEFKLLVQKPAMPRDEAQQLLQEMANTTTPTVTLAVQGGIFAEGIDLPGNAVIGAIIIGPGLPAFTLERNCIKEYFEQRHGDGFNYAYTYPAMAKTIQAAGRVIRTENDKGLIVLLGKRFYSKKYAQCMPNDWFRLSTDELTSQSLLSDIDKFWKTK